MNARRKRCPWAVGDVFAIPLKDGTHCLGQVLAREPDALNCVAVALFDRKESRVDPSEFARLGPDDVYSSLFVSTDSLDSGQWQVVGQRQPVLAGPDLPNEHLRANRFVGAKVRGSEIVDEFVNAYYGLMPWDDWYVPDYLDAFLVSPDRKPFDRLVYSGRHPR